MTGTGVGVISGAFDEEEYVAGGVTVGTGVAVATGVGTGVAVATTGGSGGTGVAVGVPVGTSVGSPAPWPDIHPATSKNKDTSDTKIMDLTDLSMDMAIPLYLIA
jgi:hypothetical protein